MLARHLAPAAVLAAVLLQSGCAAPHASPEAIQRLDPAALAGIESARQPALPLSLDEVVARSRAGQPGAALIDEIRRTGTRHPISPSEAVRLKAQGVAPEVLDALDEAHQRWARDEAAAARARRDAEQAAKQTVRNLGGGEVRIQGRDGRWRDSDTVPPGNDPNPPRDRKH